MSADNYILIRKEEHSGGGNNALTGRMLIQYVGYNEYASEKEPSYSRPVFNVFTLEDAIVHAQQSKTEYGYRFEGIGENAS